MLASRLQIGQRAVLCKVLISRRKVVTTDYSGAGFFELALCGIVEAFGGGSVNMSFYAASEIAPTCRALLLLKDSQRFGACHVFSDILAKYDDRVRTRLKALQQEAEREVKRRIAAGEKQMTVVDELGPSLLESLIIVLQNEVVSMEGWCYRCNQHVPHMSTCTGCSSSAVERCRHHLR